MPSELVFSIRGKVLVLYGPFATCSEGLLVFDHLFYYCDRYGDHDMARVHEDRVYDSRVQVEGPVEDERADIGSRNTNN